MEQRALKFTLTSSNTVFLTQFHQFGIITDIDNAERFIFSPQLQGHLTGRPLQVFQREMTTTRSIKQRRKRIIKYLRRGKPAGIEIGETTCKEVFARSSFNTLVQNALHPLDAA